MVNCEIEETDEKVIITSDVDTFWCLYDGLFDDWLVSKKGTNVEQNIYHETKVEAINEALYRIGLLCD